jgi:hypothetical protein
MKGFIMADSNVDTNDVKLTSSLIEDISYVDGSLDIPPDQNPKLPPMIGRTIGRVGPEWKITLLADRKGSSDVAKNFVNKTGGPFHEYAPVGGGTGHKPDGLNFYFSVRITWNIGGVRVTDEVYLGQGRSGTRDNWWIGGNKVVNIGTPSYLAISEDVIRQIFQMSGGVNSFDFTTKV